MEDNNERKDEQAPFNMAIACLKRIDDLLQQFATISWLPTENAIGRTNAKYKLLQQTYLAAVPLISDKDKKKMLKAKIDRLSKDFFLVWRKGSRVPMCYENTESLIDTSMEEITEALQAEKYFMPPKNDPRFSWKQ